MKFGFAGLQMIRDNRIALAKCLERIPLHLCKVAGLACSNPLQLILKNARPCYEPTGDKAMWCGKDFCHHSRICLCKCWKCHFVCYQPNTKKYNLWHYVCCESSKHFIDLSSVRYFGIDLRAVSTEMWGRTGGGGRRLLKKNRLGADGKNLNFGRGVSEKIEQKRGAGWGGKNGWGLGVLNRGGRGSSHNPHPTPWLFCWYC